MPRRILLSLTLSEAEVLLAAATSAEAAYGDHEIYAGMSKRQAAAAQNALSRVINKLRDARKET